MNAPNSNVVNPWSGAFASAWNQVIEVVEIYFNYLATFWSNTGVGALNTGRNHTFRVVASIFAIVVTLLMLLGIIMLPLAFLAAWWGFPRLGNFFLLDEIICEVIAFLLLGLVGKALKTAFLTVILGKNITIDAPLKLSANLAAYFASITGVSFGSVGWAFKTAIAGLPWDNSKEIAAITGPEWKKPETVDILEDAQKTWADGLGAQITWWVNGITSFFIAMLFLGIIPLCLNVYLGFGGHGETGRWLNYFGTLFGVTVIVIAMAISVARSKNSRRIAVASVVIVSFGLAGIVTQYYSGALAKYSVLAEQKRARQQTELNGENIQLAVLRSFHGAVVTSSTPVYEVYRKGGEWYLQKDNLGNPVRSILLQLAADDTIAYLPNKRGGIHLLKAEFGEPLAIGMLISNGMPVLGTEFAVPGNSFTTCQLPKLIR